MSLYADQLLPRIVNFVMDSPTLADQRAMVASGLYGVVLELGFGSGLNLPHYPQEVDLVRAVDPAVLGRRLALERIADSPVKVSYAGLDGAALALEDGSVDCSLVTWSLCTIPAPAEALAEVHRVLKPGGTLHFIEHGLAPDPGPRKWQDRLNPLQRVVAGGCNLNRPMDSLVREAGFDLEKLDRFYLGGVPRWAGATYRGVARRVS